MQLQDMYQEIILDHYRNPHHKGLRDPFDAQVYHVNPTCGDEVTLRVALKRVSPEQISPDNMGDGEAVVDDVSFESLGCSISQASASIMTDLVIGKPVNEAMKIGDAFLELMQSKGQLEPDEDILEDAVAFAGVSRYPARIKCALLGWMAWKDATAQALAAPPGDDPPLRSPGGTTPPYPPEAPAARPMGEPDDIGRAVGNGNSETDRGQA